MKKDKLKKIYEALSPFDTGIEETFTSLDKEIADVSVKLKETITAKTLDEVNSQFKKLRKPFEFLVVAFDDLKVKLTERDAKLVSFLQNRLKELNESFKNAQKMTAEEIAEKGEEITEIKNSLEELSNRKVETVDFAPQIEDTEKRLTKLISSLEDEIKNKDDIEKITRDLKDLTSSLEIVRIDSLKRGGGNSNRQINVKSSVMSQKYTDINFANAGGISWSASDDIVNKRVNITASIIASGSGGAGNPGGNSTEIQFNDGGSFGGASVLTWNKSTSILAIRGAVQFNGGTSDNVKIQSASVAGNWVLTLPVNDGSAGQYLLTDGGGITQWASVTAAGSLTVLSATGTINDTNLLFDFASEPKLIFINGIAYRSTGGAITWSYAAPTATLSQPVGTGGDIFGTS